jgi:hypothetical protein
VKDGVSGQLRRQQYQLIADRAVSRNLREVGPHLAELVSGTGIGAVEVDRRDALVIWVGMGSVARLRDGAASDALLSSSAQYCPSR